QATDRARATSRAARRVAAPGARTPCGRARRRRGRLDAGGRARDLRGDRGDRRVRGPAMRAASKLRSGFKRLQPAVLPSRAARRSRGRLSRRVRLQTLTAAVLVIAAGMAAGSAPAGFVEGVRLEPAASWVAGKPVHVWCARTAADLQRLWPGGPDVL